MNEKQKWLPKWHFYASPEHEARRLMKPRRPASLEELDVFLRLPEPWI